MLAKFYSVLFFQIALTKENGNGSKDTTIQDNPFDKVFHCWLNTYDIPITDFLSISGMHING